MLIGFEPTYPLGNLIYSQAQSTALPPSNIFVLRRGNGPLFFGWKPNVLTDRRNGHVREFNFIFNRVVSNYSLHSLERPNIRTGSETWTRTNISVQWILSPSCLPIPSSQHISLYWRWDSNPHEHSYSKDFESIVPTIPPLQRFLFMCTEGGTRTHTHFCTSS